MQQKMILDQRQLSNRRGSYGPLGNAAANGCGTVALYNLLQLLGQPVAYERLERQLCRHWLSATLAGGLLGSNPLYIFLLLRRLTGVRLRFHLYCGGTHPRWMEQEHLFLNLYIYRIGAHYSVCEYNAGTLRIYNDPVSAQSYPEYYHRVKAHGMLVAEIIKG
jgi:hypothetical protein